MTPRSSIPIALLAALLAGLIAPNPAQAENNDKASGNGQAKAPPRAKVTVFLLRNDEVEARARARVAHSLVKGLREDPRLQVKDPDKLLVEFAGDIPTAEIEEAKADIQKGMEMLDKGDTIFALEQFKKAIASMEPLLAFMRKDTLAQAYLALGVCQAKAGAAKAAYRTFLELLTWRPRHPFDTNRFGARFLPLYVRAQEAVAKLPRGSVELKTVPAGANAYVNGRFIGITPAVAYGLPVGQHFATFKKEGFIKGVRKVTVSPDEQKRYTVPLRQSEKFLLLKQALERIETGLGSKEATDPMLDLRSFLFIDQAVFARVRPAAEGQVEVSSYLYDLRSKQLLNQATRTLRVGKTSDARELVSLLYTGVRYDGLLEAPPEPPPPPTTTRSPIYKKWWFWTAVGVVVAGAVVPAAVLGSGGSSCPDGQRCLSIQN